MGENFKKIDPTTGDSKTRIRKKFSKCNLDSITRYPKECLTDIEIIRRDLRNMDVHIDNSEMMTHIQSNLPQAYQNIV